MTNDHSSPITRPSETRPSEFEYANLRSRLSTLARPAVRPLLALADHHPPGRARAAQEPLGAWRHVAGAHSRASPGDVHDLLGTAGTAGQRRRSQHHRGNVQLAE